MSAWSIREHEIATAPNNIPVLVGCRWVDGDLGRFLHLVGDGLLDFGLAFQRAQNAATEDGFLVVEVCDLSGLTAIVSGLSL